jgi:hypothetical protein
MTGRIWKIKIPKEVFSVAIAYKGSWRGAWWNIDAIANYHFQFSQSMFAIMRWLKLPILDKRIELILKQAIKTNPIPFLQSWYLNEGLPQNIIPNENENGMDTVIRHFIWNYVTDAYINEATRIITKNHVPRSPDEWLTHISDIGTYSIHLLWHILYHSNATKNIKEACKILVARNVGFTNEDSIQKRQRRLARFREKTAEFTNHSIDHLDKMVQWKIDQFNTGSHCLFREEVNAILKMGEMITGRQFIMIEIIRNIFGKDIIV